MSFPIVLSRPLFIIFLFFLSISSFAQTNFSVEKGKLNLENWDFEQNPILSLDGEWEFYPNQLITAKNKLNQETKPVYIQVPSFWNFTQVNNQSFGGFGYGTYYLQVNLPKDTKDLALKIKTVATSCKIYVNGHLLKEVGKVGTDKESSKPNYQPQVISFPASQSEQLEIVIQVSNFHHYKGGLWDSIKLGKGKDLYLAQQSTTQLEAFFWGSFFTIGIFFIGLFLRRRKDNFPSLYFALFCINIGLRTMVIDEVFLAPMGWYLVVYVEYGMLYSAPLFFFFFIRSLFPEELNKLIKIITTVPFYIVLVIFLVSPIYMFTAIVPYVQFFLILSLISAVYVILKAYLKKREGAAFLFWAFISLFLAVINDILYSHSIIHTMNLAAWSIMLLIISQALMLTYRFFNILKNNEQLSAELQYTNQNLENLVHQRTKRLEKANQEITSQKDIVEKQRDETESLYKAQTSSINAAKQIQKAILPYESKLQNLLKDYFIINRPKDVVSGDFYWLNEVDGKTILIVADCTGHGVQGAFMTLIGANLLDKIVRIWNITNPSEILTRLHEEIYIVLDQENTRNNSGMDAVALCWEKQNSQTEMMFAGAKNNLFYFSNQDLKELKGARKSIGGFQNEETQFETQKITLNPEDIIYLGSDGLEDQNNVKRKKIGKPCLMNLLSENASLPLHQQQEKIELFLEQHMKNTSQRDDILWIGIKF